jgi:HSP20 family molecular chaperone IbpA
MQGQNEGQAHDLVKMEDLGERIRIHVELPPIAPQHVLVDITGDVIEIITLEGKPAVYCSIDLPQNVDPLKLQKTVVRGHMELVLPKLHDETSIVG